MLIRIASFSLVSLLLLGCAQNPYYPGWKVSARYDAYENYRPTPIEIAQLRASYDAAVLANTSKKPVNPRGVAINPYLSYRVTDADVVLYADHVRDIFVTKFSNARFARYTTATTQVLLAAGAGVAAAFSGGTSLIAGLAFGSAVTPEVGKIFNAKERAEIYRLAALKIDFGLNDYSVSFDGQPNATILTPAGRELARSVYLAIELAEEKMSGQLVVLKTSAESDAFAKGLSDKLKPKPTPSPSPSPAPVGKKK